MGGCGSRKCECLKGSGWEYSSLGNFQKSSYRSPHFLHSERHFNPSYPIKQTFVAHGGEGGGVQMHLSHPLPMALIIIPTIILCVLCFYSKKGENSLRSSEPSELKHNISFFTGH